MIEERKIPPFFGNNTKDWIQIVNSLEDETKRILQDHKPKSNSYSTITVVHVLKHAINQFVNGKLLYVASAPALSNTNDIFGDWSFQNLEHRLYKDKAIMLAYQDNFLHPSTLAKINNFVLDSTIYLFAKGNSDGYLGAYLEAGLASGLLLQIAGELKNRLPILQNKRLVQAWSYKYTGPGGDEEKDEENRKGINIHADEAAINVNFWITPSSPTQIGGGLEIFDKLAPDDMSFDDMNRDQTKILEFLHDAKKTTVSYRANRMVIFDSRLFHRTQDFCFKTGYKERRINLTFLYGER